MTMIIKILGRVWMMIKALVIIMLKTLTTIEKIIIKIFGT